MITDHFSLTPRSEPTFDVDEISGALSELSAVLKPVKILNYYRELPITSFSSLERFDAGKFEIKVSEMHIQVISSQMQTILCLDDFTVLAECSSLNIPESSVVTYGFRYIELYADKREAFRLSMNIDVELLVNLRNSGGRIYGRLVDISVTGCKIETPGSDLKVNSMTVLEIKIFSQEKNREVTRSIAARIVHVYESGGISYCCLEFVGTPSDQDLLAAYLNQKQSALVRDFRQNRVLA